jgi:hypothetical protein
MTTSAFLKSKLTYFSVIGSILYGLMCASYPTPEVVAVIGHVAYFLSAALFYFAMYVICSPCSFKKIIKIFAGCILSFMAMILFTSIIYMQINNAPYIEANDVVTIFFSRILYYLPFLP